MRFTFDPAKSERLRNNPKRKIGFEEAQAIWELPYYEDCLLMISNNSGLSDGDRENYIPSFSKCVKMGMENIIIL